MTYGATLTQVLAPDKAGRAAVVTLYLDTLADYLAGHPLFGSTVGRFANRIAGAKFVIDGAEHKLTANAGQHHIHGGVAEGFQKAVWRAEIVPEPGTAAVRMTHTSPDGAAGYPGTLRATVLFKVTPDRRLTLDYTAQTDKPTHVNLTNHAYWNLAGAGSGDVLGHVLSLRASRVLAADESRMPTGEILSVRGTPLDFTSPHTIGERVRQTQGENYDDCYVLDKPPGERLALAAIVTEPASDRVMTVHTTQPGVQLYTARHLTDRLRAGGRPYGPYHGLCLETQHFPNAPNHPEWPTTLLRPGETLHETTVHAFSTT
jgi:aldose 1-epimerase